MQRRAHSIPLLTNNTRSSKCSSSRRRSTAAGAFSSLVRAVCRCCCCCQCWCWECGAACCAARGVAARGERQGKLPRPAVLHMPAQQNNAKAQPWSTQALDAAACVALHSQRHEVAQCDRTSDSNPQYAVVKKPSHQAASFALPRPVQHDSVQQVPSMDPTCHHCGYCNYYMPAH
jgi:hypothetical protein